MNFKKFKIWLNENEINDIIVLIPGSFKPMHAAHVNLIKRYVNYPGVKEVKVLIGPGVRNGITQKEAYIIAKKLLSDLEKVSIECVEYPSPILTAYKYMETAKPGVYALGSSKKGKDNEDYKRVIKFTNDYSSGGRYYDKLPDGVKVIELPVDSTPIFYNNRTDEYNNYPISASVLRHDILNNDYKNFKTNYPGYDENIIKFIWDLTKNNITESLNEEEKRVNVHMMHIEELLFEGKDALDKIKFMINELIKKLLGESSKITLSVKIDGAPAMTAWTSFPGLKSHGVSTKSLFNKTKTVAFYTPDDIDKVYEDNPKLAYSLKLLLKYVKYINIPENEIWQGDFLFNNKTIKDEGDSYSFKPNTIKYVIEKTNSELSSKIANAEIGIVWHTRYTGNNINNVKANYNIDISKLNEVKGIYMSEPYIKKISTTVTNELINLQNEADNIFKDIDILKQQKNYDNIVEFKDLKLLFKKFHNKKIRNRQDLDNKIFIKEFLNFIEEEKGHNFIEKRNIDEFLQSNKNIYYIIIDIINKLTSFKRKLVQKLNNFALYKSYVELKSGETKSINQEGFAISSPNGDIVKIINREEFSYMNFSPDVLRDWEH